MAAASLCERNAGMKDKNLFIKEIAEKYDIHQWARVAVKDFCFHPEVREICERNACGMYGKTWTCPPALGAYEQCRAFCLSYENAFVFTGKYDLEDSYDFDGMMEGKEQFRKICLQIKDLWEAEYGECVLLGNSSCRSCEKCTYPDSPCRFPESTIPSLEGYGVMVNRLADTAGINYINGKDTVTYFAAVLY